MPISHGVAVTARPHLEVDPPTNTPSFSLFTRWRLLVYLVLLLIAAMLVQYGQRVADPIPAQPTTGSTYED
jgi:hypothetical protein